MSSIGFSSASKTRPAPISPAWKGGRRWVPGCVKPHAEAVRGVPTASSSSLPRCPQTFCSEGGKLAEVLLLQQTMLEVK